MNTLNEEPFSTWLINLKIYRIYYDFINAFNPTIIFLILAVLVLAIPYIIVSIYLLIKFLTKYKNEKRNIGKTIIYSALLILTLSFSLKIFPLTGRYVVKINSRANEISDTEISKFIQNNIKGNPYIKNIRIKQGFPNDYDIKVNYFDKGFKNKEAFMSSRNYYQIIGENAKDVTGIHTGISVVLLITNIILYVFFCKHIIKEYESFKD